MKKLLFLGLVCTSTLFSADIKLYTEDFPPYQTNENGKLSGISIDIINEIKKRVKDDISIESNDWDTSYNKALNNKNCGVFSTGRTKDRESLFKWIGPIGKTKYIFFTNAQNDYYIGNPEDAQVKAKHILVSKNDVSHQILTNLGIKNLKVSDDKSSKENIQTVAKDKDVLWASDYYSGIYKIRKLGLESKIKPMMSNRPFIATTMNIAFNINTDEKVIENWNQALKQIVDDGTYAKIMQKYE